MYKANKQSNRDLKTKKMVKIEAYDMKETKK